jgi:hypothetical protein
MQNEQIQASFLEEISWPGKVMKIILVMFICSGVAQNCIPPITSPQIYEDEYSCMMAGYTTAASMTKDMGREEVNKHNIYIKFECHKSDTLKPGINS